jgi:hypothetical protein
MTPEERFSRIETTLDRVANTLAAITDNQVKFDTVLSVLAEEQIKLSQEMRAMERRWEAYLNTIRPQ